MAAAVLTAALVLPFHPHTHAELADWQTSWTERMAEGETPKLIAEFLDMADRHPCRLVECPQPKEVASDPGTAGAATTPPPANSGMGDNVEQWRNLVAAYFPPEHVDRMLRIMACESGGNPSAKNPHSSATGLFQIMGFWQRAWPGDYTNPWTNVAVAYQIWLEQGYQAWVCKG